MHPELEELRKKLDEIDHQLIELLGKRFVVTKKVGEYKKTHHLDPVDLAREATQFAKFEKLAGLAQLNPTLVKRLFETIISEVKINHKKL